MITWPEKDPAESFPVGFDFSGDMAAMETVTGVALTVTVLRGTDAAPEAMLLGAAQMAGTRVMQSITGGVTGVIYAFKCVATTSAGQTLVRAARLPVSNAVRWA